MGKDYGTWSLADLKSELRKRNAKVTGKKAVLVQRLEDYDKLFGPLVSESESVFKIDVPSPEHFRDVTSASVMPAFTQEDLTMFCTLAERKDVETSQNMYKESFLLSCRSAHKDGDYYVTGLCASEMRKNISYSVTIKAKHHMVLEAQCECAAGIGPFAQCKHVIVVIFGMIEFNEKKSILLKGSCTSTLQTFHHPSTSYTGNPVQAENLVLKFKDTKLKEITTFDPRTTTEDAEKYKNDFKSLIANFCGGGNENMAMSQIIMPADKRSLFKDHDYMQKTAEENYFDSLVLDENQINDLQTKTDTKEWLEERKLRLQSSDFGKICKQKNNKQKLAETLLKNTEIQTPAIKHGKKYEPVAIKKFEQVTGVSGAKSGIIVHPQYQFLGCTPDALVQNELLEVKCPFTSRNKNISGESVPYLYLCEETGEFKLDKNHDYYYQVQGQMFCSQRNITNFFVYTMCDYCLIKIERDDEFITKMVEQLECFYNDYYKPAMLNRFLYGKRK